MHLPCFSAAPLPFPSTPIDRDRVLTCDGSFLSREVFCSVQGVGFDFQYVEVDACFVLIRFLGRGISMRDERASFNEFVKATKCLKE